MNQPGPYEELFSREVLFLLVRRKLLLNRQGGPADLFAVMVSLQGHGEG
ncbi:MAG: hypothetical protein JW747_01090 [Candidatus Aminicenantes bacterium]|nr:hypothetical protein [Candidatus Aminicenantes bacterium]